MYVLTYHVKPTVKNANNGHSEVPVTNIATQIGDIASEALTIWTRTFLCVCVCVCVCNNVCIY